MFDVYFSYFDGNEYLCQNVKKITVPTVNGMKAVSGDEILNYCYRIHSEIYLHSDSVCYSISCQNLKAIEIRKK